MHLQIKGLDELTQRFAKSPEIVERAFTKALGSATQLLHRSAGEVTPIDTGFLRNSFTTGVERMVGRVLNTAPYAPFVHEGTDVWPLSIPTKNPNTVRQFFLSAIEATRETVGGFWQKAAEEVVENLAK